MKPRVSVIIATFNAEKTIGLAVESILDQSYEDFEIIVVDDGSTDRTVDILQQFADERIRVFGDKTNKGAGARRNEAIDLSRGEYIAVMDADDISYPERFKKQVEFLDRNPDISIVGTAAIVFNDKGVAHSLMPVSPEHEEICIYPWKGMALIHPTLMGRAEWFRKYRYSKMPRAQDHDMLLRAVHDSKYANIPEILFAYRQNTISVQKNIRSKWYYAQSVFTTYWNRQERMLALWGYSVQMAKISVYAVSTLLQLKKLFLKHLNILPSQEDIQQWERVWERLNRNTCTTKS